MRPKILTKHSELEEIIVKSNYCSLAMVDGDKPYVLPFNFGFDNEMIYLHSDPKGKKIDILEKNPNVCLNFTTDTELFFRDEHVACSYGMKYKSVVVYGEVEFIEDYDEKVKAMNVIMKQYTKKEFSYNAPAIRNVKVFKVIIKEMTGKAYGDFN